MSKHYCKYCGFELCDGDIYCRECGKSNIKENKTIMHCNCPVHKSQTMNINSMGLYTCPICMIETQKWVKVQQEKHPLQPQEYKIVDD